MSDESTETGASRGNERPLSPSALAAADARPELGQQAGWQFAADGSGVIIEAPAIAHRRSRIGQTLRADARRTAEYLATRGKTPVEALHDVARMDWRKAVRQIARELQCTKLEAFRVWQSCNVALLPHSAPRLDTLELGSALGAGAGGLTMAHFLAASMVADRMAAAVAVQPSTDHRSVDSPVTPQLPWDGEGGRSGAQGESAPALPPKPPD